MAKVSVRYIVDDVDAAIDFYCRQLGFHEDMHAAPTFAMLSRGDLRLVLARPVAAPGATAIVPMNTGSGRLNCNRCPAASTNVPPASPIKSAPAARSHSFSRSNVTVASTRPMAVNARA